MNGKLIFEAHSKALVRTGKRWHEIHDWARPKFVSISVRLLLANRSAPALCFTRRNFLTGDEGPERIEAALGKGLQRLAEVKAKWDPQNVFSTNRNIKPKAIV